MKSNEWIIQYHRRFWYDRHYINTFYGFKAILVKHWVKLKSLRTTFKGYGKARLDFGNCQKRGCTTVFLNNKMISTAGPRVYSKVITFNYTPGSVLIIQGYYPGVILNNLKLECGSEYIINDVHLHIITTPHFNYDILFNCKSILFQITCHKPQR